jgi:hypothetical protein
MTDHYCIFICDYCRIAIPIPAVDKPAWEANHRHEDDE